jgi:hypothetical protein
MAAKADDDEGGGVHARPARPRGTDRGRVYTRYAARRSSTCDVSLPWIPAATTDYRSAVAVTGLLRTYTSVGPPSGVVVTAALKRPCCRPVPQARTRGVTARLGRLPAIPRLLSKCPRLLSWAITSTRLFRHNETRPSSHAIIWRQKMDRIEHLIDTFRRDHPEMDASVLMEFAQHVRRVLLDELRDEMKDGDREIRLSIILHGNSFHARGPRSYVEQLLEDWAAAASAPPTKTLTPGFNRMKLISGRSR